LPGDVGTEPGELAFEAVQGTVFEIFVQDDVDGQAGRDVAGGKANRRFGK
jgi:hypothetical protein